MVATGFSLVYGLLVPCEEYYKAIGLDPNDEEYDDKCAEIYYSWGVTLYSLVRENGEEIKIKLFPLPHDDCDQFYNKIPQFVIGILVAEHEGFGKEFGSWSGTNPLINYTKITTTPVTFDEFMRNFPLLKELSRSWMGGYYVVKNDCTCCS